MIIDFDQLSSFLGWCSIINICLLALSFIAILILKDKLVKTHSALMAVKAESLPMIYINLLGIYKLMIITFNVVPYFSLMLMH